jgi:hypothetical protein
MLFAQQIDNVKFGTWINLELKKALESNKVSDSSLNISPRFIYLKNNKSIEISYRYEQRVHSYKIIQVLSNIIYFQRGRIVLNSDSILLEDKYYGNTLFVKKIN